MNLFFSPAVNSYQVFVAQFQVCQVVEKLVDTGYVQFQLNPYDDPNDPYFIIYTRVKALKLKLNRMLSQIQSKYHEEIKEMTRNDKKQTLLKMKQYMKGNKVDHLKYLDYEQQWLEDKMRKFYQISTHYDNFTSQLNRLQQQLDALRAKIQVCQDGLVMEQFVIVSGVCGNQNISMLERIIFRQSKGHSITVFKARAKDSSTSVFLCMMNKGVFKHAGPKIAKSCQNNGVTIFEFPNSLRNLGEYEQHLIKKIREAEEVVEISAKELTMVLHESIVGDGISLNQHLVRVAYLERIVYIICQSKKVGGPSSHTVLTFYMPSDKALPELPSAIFPNTSSKVKPRTIIPRLQCLTEVNIMTELFSIPKHNELIPSVFMFTTVPILFGMMFSDFGHGLLLLSVSVLLQLNPIFYLMSFMSIYCGVIYNQFFGMKVIRWGNLGVVQPVWAVSENGLNFQNSLKMKISMVVAFFHMGFGMALKIVNEYKRGQYNRIIYDSAPKIGLLFTTVGYLVLLIITKWLTNFSGSESTAPSIINSLLELYLGWNPQRKHSIFRSVEYEHQLGSMLNMISTFFILVMVYNHTIRHRCETILSRLLRYSHTGGYRPLGEQHGEPEGIDQQISEQLEQESHQNYNSIVKAGHDHYWEAEESHESELGPLEVFQFVLSLISSTTSYLRLFALSLAHAKLSALILDMLLSTLSGSHPYISLARCLAFFSITLGMMLTLDVMECMMHVVRLHWVEWMGKFYTGSGVLFNPEVPELYA